MELDEFIELVKEQQGIDLSGVLTTADKIGRPQQALDREAYDDFMKRNPMMDGGRMGFYKGKLVTQGDNKGKYVIYNVPESVSKTKTKYFPNEKAMNKWIKSQPGKGRKDFGKFVTGAQFKDTIRPQNLEKLEKLKQIIIKSNSQYKKSLTSKAALEAAGFPGGYQAIATKGRLREEVKKEIAKLLTTQQKIDNYVNNVMFAEDALVKDFKNPLTHIANKFGVSSGTLRNWAKNSQVYLDNKPIFVGLSRELNYNKYKFIGADNTPRLMSDYSVIMQNKLPSSASLIRGDSAEKFILQSAYRHFKQSKEAGRAAKVTFIGDPDLLPFNEWKFIKGGKLYSVDPAIDTLEFQGKTYTNNYLNRIDAKDIYKNDFGEIYKIFDDLETYMNSTTTVGNKDVKLDTILRKRLYDATGKKDYLLRRAVDIDHFSGILDEPFKNLRLLDRRSNQLAGIIKRQSKYKNNPKLLNKVLTDIGYTTPYKDIDTFVKRSIKNINTPVRNVEGIPINIKNKFAVLGGGKCARGFKNQGGRVGLKDGPVNVDVCFTNAMERIRKGGVDFTKAEANNFSKLTKGLRAIGASNIMKFGILPEVLFEGALIADKMASEGDSFMQGLRNSYVAIPFQAMGVMKTYDEGRKDEILAATPEIRTTKAGPFSYLPEKILPSQRGKVLDVMSMQDTLKKRNELAAQSQNLKNQIEDTDRISDGAFGYVGDSQDLQKRLSETRADLQDLYRGDAGRAERMLTSSPLDLNIKDQLTMDAYKSAVEKADADRASNILFAPGAGLGIDTQIKKRMKELPITPEIAKEQLQATGDFFGMGYTPYGMNQLFTLMGREDPRFGYDETGKYSEEKGLNDFINYLRTQQFAENFRDEKAGGGIAGLSGGDPEGAMTRSMNPDSQGLSYLLNRVKNT